MFAAYTLSGPTNQPPSKQQEKQPVTVGLDYSTNESPTQYPVHKSWTKQIIHLTT